MDIADHIDATGLLCPLPVLKLLKRISALAPGQYIELRADDPAAIVDVPHYCTESGHELVSMTEADGAQIYILRKAS